MNCITVITSVEGIEKTKTENKTKINNNKTVWRIFLSLMLWENSNKHKNGFSILIGCLHRTIILCSLFIGLF